jgi:hypothetical protein
MASFPRLARCAAHLAAGFADETIATTVTGHAGLAFAPRHVKAFLHERVAAQPGFARVEERTAFAQLRRFGALRRNQTARQQQQPLQNRKRQRTDA